MVREYVYSPHIDFYIDMVERSEGYDMHGFHAHHKYEIYYEIEGTRRYFIEDASYLVNAGNVVLIGKNEIHKTGAVENSASSRIVCNFSEEYLKSLADAFPEVDFLGFMDGGAKVLNISVKQQSRVYGLLKQMVELFKNDTAENRVLCKLQLGCLLLLLREQAEKQADFAQENRQATNETVEAIQSYIAVHYAEKLTLSGIASQFYISPYYLSRLFKKNISLSLVEYINGVRIKAAQHLLEKGNCKVSDVAEKSGFLTSAHFRRVFKDSTGLSPQQYRKLYRNANSEDET